MDRAEKGKKDAQARWVSALKILKVVLALRLRASVQPVQRVLLLKRAFWFLMCFGGKPPFSCQGF